MSFHLLIITATLTGAVAISTINFHLLSCSQSGVIQPWDHCNSYFAQAELFEIVTFSLKQPFGPAATTIIFANSRRENTH